MIRHKEGLTEAYDSYEGGLTKAEYRTILQNYYPKVIDRIIFDNLDYRISGIGRIYIGKFKPKVKLWEAGIKPTLPINWVETKKHGKIIFHMNENRYGYLFRIKLKKLRFKNNTIFKFQPERWNFKRYLSKILNDEDIKIDAPLIN